MPYRLLCLICLILLFSSCKKDKRDDPVPANGTRLEKSVDSLYLYAKETYLWYNALPAYPDFSPRQYALDGNELASMQSALKAITAYAVNPLTQKPYELAPGASQPRYSYIVEGKGNAGRQGTVDLDGKGNDLGLSLAVVNNSAVYVRSVEPNSPAALAGISRGMQVTLIDNQPVLLRTATLNNYLTRSTLSLTLLSANGTSFSKTLTARNYTAPPVLSARVLQSNNQSIAYIALSRFSDWQTAQASLDNAFAQFAGKGITSMIVDLRYNSGGYVETAEQVANLIAPASLNGSVMYAEHFNALLQQGKAPVLKTIPYLDDKGEPVYVNGHKATYADVDYSVAGNTFTFAKKGGLSTLKSIVFIVSEATASASELLINSFKPYVNVKLVGSTTYGKPVGFFGIPIAQFTVYLSQFRILNAKGAGDYYAGLQPDIVAADDVTHDFGDPAEACLNAALNYIDNSGFRLAPAARLQVSSTAAPAFTGMIENRRRFLH